MVDWKSAAEIAKDACEETLWFFCIPAVAHSHYSGLR
jgi:hypothetical protein